MGPRGGDFRGQARVRTAPAPAAPAAPAAPVVAPGGGATPSAVAAASRQPLSAVVRAIVQMQDAMRAMQLKMERTDDAVRVVARGLDDMVPMLQSVVRRLGALEHRQTPPPSSYRPQRRPSPTSTSDDSRAPGPALARVHVLARAASPHTRSPQRFASLPATRLRAALSPARSPASSPAPSHALPRSLSCGPAPGLLACAPAPPHADAQPLRRSVSCTSDPHVHGPLAPRPGPFADALAAEPRGACHAPSDSASYATEQAQSSCPPGLPAGPPPALADSLHAQARLPGPQQAFQSPNLPTGLAPRFTPGASQFPPCGGGNMAAQSPYCNSPRPTAGAQISAAPASSYTPYAGPAAPAPAPAPLYFYGPAHPSPPPPTTAPQLAASSTGAAAINSCPPQKPSAPPCDGCKPDALSSRSSGRAASHPPPPPPPAGDAAAPAPAPAAAAAALAAFSSCDTCPSADPPSTSSASSLKSRPAAGAAARGAGPAAASTPSCERGGALQRRLLKAARDGRLQEVRALLSAGARPDGPAAGHWTALHRAAAKAHAEVVSLLLSRGASPNARDCYGRTPLHMAAYKDPQCECVALLIGALSDLELRDRSGRTPLHSAAKCGNCKAVQALLAAGARTSAKDNKGRTPFDVARADCLRFFLPPNYVIS